MALTLTLPPLSVLVFDTETPGPGPWTHLLELYTDHRTKLMAALAMAFVALCVWHGPGGGPGGGGGGTVLGTGSVAADAGGGAASLPHGELRRRRLEALDRRTAPQR